VWELDAQDRRLQRVEPRVVADQLEGLLVARPVEAQHPHALGDLVVACEHRAAVAEGAEVLGREEGQSGGRAQRARAAGRRTRAERLRGVLEHGHAERLDLGHRRDVAEQVDDDDRLRALGQRRAYRLRGDAERLGVDVAEHGPRAGQRDRLGRGVERERWDHDLVAGPDAHRPQRQRDGVGAVADPDHVAGAQIVAQLGLERLELRPEDEAARVDDLGDAGLDLLAQWVEGRTGVEKGYWHRRAHTLVSASLGASLRLSRQMALVRLSAGGPCTCADSSLPASS
jgi:hypothetical protein